MARKNLIKRMIDENITQHDIAVALGLTEKTAKKKIDGVADFKFEEIMTLKHKFFKDDQLETLFQNLI